MLGASTGYNTVVNNHCVGASGLTTAFVDNGIANTNSMQWTTKRGAIGSAENYKIDVSDSTVNDILLYDLNSGNGG